MPDADLETFLLKITFMSPEEISDVLRKHSSDPESRHGQRVLAETVVEMAHGKRSLQAVRGSTEAFFQSGDLTGMS